MRSLFIRRLKSAIRIRRRRKYTIGHKQHFKSATTGVATKTMRNELNRLVNTVEGDPNKKKVNLLNLFFC